MSLELKCKWRSKRQDAAPCFESELQQTNINIQFVFPEIQIFRWINDQRILSLSRCHPSLLLLSFSSPLTHQILKSKAGKFRLDSWSHWEFKAGKSDKSNMWDDKNIAVKTFSAANSLLQSTFYSSSCLNSLKYWMKWKAKVLLLATEMYILRAGAGMWSG